MIRQWRQTVLLGRTFFGRMFESELMPAGLPQVQLIIGAIVLLATPPMLVPLTRGGKYAYLWFYPGTLAQAIATDRLLLITLSMIGMGFLGLVIWEGVFPIDATRGSSRCCRSERRRSWSRGSEPSPACSRFSCLARS